jgi:nucleoid-associated protein YgaU
VHDYRIQSGETLSSISTTFYGSPAYYPAIVKANPGIDPQRLKVGTTIKLPDASAVKPSASDATHASARIPGSTAAPAAAIDANSEYKVQPGDSLHKIAVKLYGKSTEADKIYQLNKQMIGDDPHRLKVGQVLKLPEPPTVTTSASR